MHVEKQSEEAYRHGGRIQQESEFFCVAAEAKAAAGAWADSRICWRRSPGPKPTRVGLAQYRPDPVLYTRIL